MAGSLLPGKAFASGSLNPPPGPVAYQGRSMASISAKIAPPGSMAEGRRNILSLNPGSDCQFEIVDSGSYIMTEPLHGVLGLHGLRITASYVDLDCCGQPFIGAVDPGGTPTSSAIVCTGSVVTLSDCNTVGWQKGYDFELSSNSVIWDVTAQGASVAGIVVGNYMQIYDGDCYQCATGVHIPGQHSYIEHCGAFQCATGFKGINSPNLLMRNTATGCPVSYDLGNNSFGPICIVTPGDISVNAASRHPEANYQLP